MNSGESNNQSLKYERYASSGCLNLGIIKSGICGKNSNPLSCLSDSLLTGHYF